MHTAYDAGVNFFDNAEAYEKGSSEEIMGSVLKKAGWRRGSYLVSTKLFWGLHNNPNEKNTLNRKYLIEGINGSLKRMGLEYVDLLFCHRPDPDTPIEETVWAMHDIVSSGKAMYWGTSEWSAAEIIEAWHIAESRNLRKPVVEQPQYNLVHRRRMEKEYLPVFRKAGIGTTTWSPLASGLLTGKYTQGIPKNSRGALEGYAWLTDSLTDRANNDAVRSLERISKELDCTLSQLAIAWCACNPNVSTVITGASKVQQLQENLEAAQLIPKLSPDILAQIDEIFPVH
jgi:voltage-dependent potassium channel beta subunit